MIGNLRNLAIAELRAATDSLTGLPNRRAIADTIRRMVAQTTRTMRPLAALMCDLDHFKQINDQYGHGRGDDVLAAVGAAITSSIRVSDFAGRFGGEEFLVLLPDTDAVGAVALAEKIRSAVAAIQVPTIDRAITLSVGIAVLPDHVLDADALQRAADRALYTAKNSGRDRVEVFSNEQVPARVSEGPDPLAAPSAERVVGFVAEFAASGRRGFRPPGFAHPGRAAATAAEPEGDRRSDRHLRARFGALIGDDALRPARDAQGWPVLIRADREEPGVLQPVPGYVPRLADHVRHDHRRLPAPDAGDLVGRRALDGPSNWVSVGSARQDRASAPTRTAG